VARSVAANGKAFRTPAAAVREEAEKKTRRCLYTEKKGETWVRKRRGAGASPAPLSAD
jgi:hypothetical protein